MNPRIRRRPVVSGDARTIAYVRFVLAHKNPNSGVADGPFEAAWSLADSGKIAHADQLMLRELLDWFTDHLPDPKRLNRSRSKGFERRVPRGISWLKNSATECIANLREMAAMLEKYGYRVEMIWEDRVGYIVYEDEFQVVAEPFADTTTEGD